MLFERRRRPENDTISEKDNPGKVKMNRILVNKKYRVKFEVDTME